MQSISLDFDGTLANTQVAAFELLEGTDHEYTLEDVADWQWGFREFGRDRYLNALWHAWSIRPLDVPALEENLREKVAELRDEYRVDIVTASPDDRYIERGKRDWLRYHGVEYDDFRSVPVTSTKADLDYDIYIDDKPPLPDRVTDDSTVYLIDAPYNRDADGDYIRVGGIGGVLTDLGLRDPPIGINYRTVQP